MRSAGKPAGPAEPRTAAADRMPAARPGTRNRMTTTTTKSIGKTGKTGKTAGTSGKTGRIGTTEQTEKETTFEGTGTLDPGILRRLPAVDRVRAEPAEELDAVYYDTPDLR